MTHDQIIDAICTIAPAEIGKRWDSSPAKGKMGACIISTKIGLMVLEHFGIAAEPLCVHTVVGNADFKRWLEDGAPPLGDTLESATALGYGNAHYIDIDVDNRLKRSDGFNGHLVIGMSRAALLDLSFGQFHRPKKGIDIPNEGALFRTTPEFWTEQSECHYECNGVVVFIQQLENPPDWTTSPDWNKHHMQREVAKKIIRKVEQCTHFQQYPSTTDTTAT